MNSSDAIVARRYAAAFVLTRKPGGNLRAAFAELGSFARLLSGSAQELHNPLIPQEIKMRILHEKLFSRKDTRAFRFLELLLKVKRLYLLDAVLREGSRLLDERDGLVRAEVETAFPPDQGTAAEAEHALGAATGKTVSVRLVQAPELIAGMRVRIGDTLIDASLLGRLDRLKRKIAG
ncbi:MAG: ATP synthase F1 subunit delta [Elusimicrobiaceae bacterium]|nr:ATP synthase F1 subunit delta [Elusimicrobiaceae bacterium]